MKKDLMILGRTTYLLLFSTSLLWAACGKDSSEQESLPQCTVLFYLGGDNNLSSESSTKVEKIKSAKIEPTCRVVIYEDTRKGNPRMMEITPGKGGINTLTVVREYEESNSASEETFASVLQEVRQRYHSPSYGLVFFSHASGWLPEYTFNKPQLRSIANDNGSEMELPAFAAAIPDGMFDFIVFEACHMAGIEVAWELKNKTHYIVASSAEIVSPGFSPAYTVAMPYLYNPYEEKNLVSFCRAIESDYRTRKGDYGSLTLSLIKTKGLDEIAAAVRRSEWSQQTGNSIQSFDRNGKDLFFDFGDYYAAMQPITQYTTLQSAIDNCVIWKMATISFMPTSGGFDIVSHSGLTTYIPQEKYPKLNEAYKQLKWYKEVLKHEEEI